MSFTWTPPLLPTTLTGIFSSITRTLTDAVLGNTGRPGLTHELLQAIQRRIYGHVVGIRLLIAALQAGTVRTRRSPAAGSMRNPLPAPTGPSVMLPRTFGWLRTMMPNSALPIGEMLHFLADPELAALLAASPRLVRLMSPLCRMIGVEMPKAPAPVTPPPPPATGPVTPTTGLDDGAAGEATAGATRSVVPVAERGSADGGVARWSGGDARLR